MEPQLTAGSKSVDRVISELGFGRFQWIVIALCGVVQASDMMEIQYVSMVSQRLQCVWRISDLWKSLVTSITFLGLLVGAFFWGPLGDKLCRRSVTAVCMAYIAFYGCLTALAPSAVWVVILRFLVGTGIGGVQPLTATVLSEFMPAHRRGFAWFLFQCFWCLGGLVEIGLAWLILDKQHGWRYLAVLTAVPMLLLVPTWLLWLPPSPRQTLIQGRMAETRHTLDRMADTNKQPRFLGNFDARDLQQGEQEQGSIRELLRPNTFLRQTLLLAFIFYSCGFSYYGIILLNVQVPIILRTTCRAQWVNMTAYASDLSSPCHSCDNLNYLELLVPTLADLTNALLNAFIIERLLGRRVTMAVSFTLAAFLVPLLSLCMHSAARVALFFVARLLISCGCTVTGLYAVEAHPTTLRATAAGFISSFSRVASIIAPFIAQVFISHVSLLGGLLIFSGLLGGAAISAALLPRETKDRPLAQSEVAEAMLPEEERPALQGSPAPSGDSGGKIYGSLGEDKND